jgi:hypothetical protein
MASISFTSPTSAAGNIGTALGSGIAQGLEALGQRRVERLLNKERIEQGAQFWKSAGLPDQVAYAFAAQPAEFQRSLLDRIEGITFGGQQQQNRQEYPSMQEPDRQMQKSDVQAQQSSDSALQFKNPQEPSIKDVLGMLYGNKPQENQQQMQQMSNYQEIPERSMVSPDIVKSNDQSGAIRLGAGSQERRHRETLAQQKELADRKEKMAMYKETKDIRHEIVQSAKSARQDLRDLNRLEELQSSGNLDTPGYVEFLKRSGLDIPALTNPESEEFKKIEANFLRNAKDYFGGRISNYEVEQFLKTIPSLSQSPEGRKRVIANLKYISRGALEYNNALKEIMAENKGIPPLDLEEQIFDKTDKKLEALHKKFKEDIAKPAPKGQNKLIAALQAGAGSVIGLPGAIVSGIGKVAGNIAG